MRPMNLRIEMPDPYAPQITDMLVGILRMARKLIEKGEESDAFVKVDIEAAGRIARLYNFMDIVPTEWEDMYVWATPLLPDGTLYIAYREHYYILSVSHLLHEAKKEKRTWLLNEEQRGAVLNHVETTLETIRERGSHGIPPDFIEQLLTIKEALE